jgi:hypothetical protein
MAAGVARRKQRAQSNRRLTRKRNQFVIFNEAIDRELAL